MDWLKEHHYEGPVTVAGKNAASFDIPFLKEQYGRDYGLKFRHRVLDPTSMYVQPDDDAPPSLNTCLGSRPDRRSRIALDDAIDVVNVIRAYLARTNNVD